MNRLLACCLVATAVPAMATVQPPLSKMTVLHQFAQSDGYSPNPLVEDSDGVFFGVNTNGGANNGGTVYRVTSTGDFKLLHAFDPAGAGNDGYSPHGTLVRGADGFLYGTTTSGGTIGGYPGSQGTIYRINDAGQLTIVHSFTGPEGSQPIGGLTMAADGHLYGTASYGGLGSGTIFRLNADNSLTTIYSFPADGSQGAGVNAPLVQDANGSFYGSNNSSGGNTTIPDAGGGTIFQLTPDGTLTTLHYFPFYSGVAAPNIGPDGVLYSTQHYARDSVFHLTNTGRYLTLYDFPCYCGTVDDGAEPSGPLTMARDGYIYGTTSGGGAHGVGTIYKMTLDGEVTTVYSFDTDGPNSPQTGVIEGPDGRFYGTTQNTGSVQNNPQYGAVFKITFVPEAPTGPTVTSGDGHVQLSWTASRTTISYQVFVGTAAGGEATTPVVTGVTDTKVDITGLTNGTEYFFTVSAVNEAGAGAPSAEVNAIPTGPSSPPTTTPPAGSSPSPASTGSGGGGSIDPAVICLLLALILPTVRRRRNTEGCR